MTNLVLRGSWIFDMRTDLLHCSMCFTSLLYLHLLIMLTSPVKCESICSRESVVMVTKILEELSKVENEPNCMLYTPTLADFENCTRSTLRCYELELNVLPVEIQGVATSSKKLLSILKKLKLRIKLQDKMKSCPDCEVYREEKAKTFLETLQSILQLMNAEKLCAPRNVTQKR